MKIIKDGTAAGGVCTGEELEAVNAFARTELKAGDVYIFSVHLQMQESLVGVHHILERNVAVAVEDERGVEIVLCEQSAVILLAHPRDSLCVNAGENSPGEIPSHRHKIHHRLISAADSRQILSDFVQMLVAEQFVN